MEWMGSWVGFALVMIAGPLVLLGLARILCPPEVPPPPEPPRTSIPGRHERPPRHRTTAPGRRRRTPVRLHD